MAEPLVSILIPVYNRATLLGECIDSALGQTIKQIEVVVVDNCSDDGTWDVCQRYAEQDARVRVYRNSSNLGPVRNWRRCVELARGPFAKVLFSDDLMLPQYLAKTLPFLDDPDVGFVFTAARVGDDPARLGAAYWTLPQHPPVWSSEEYIRGALVDRGRLLPVSPGGALFRLADLRECIKLGVPSPTVRDFETTGAGVDYLTYLLIADRYLKVAHVAEALVFFRSHAGCLTYADAQLNSACYDQAVVWFAQYKRSEKELELALYDIWVRETLRARRPVSFSEIAARYLSDGMSVRLRPRPILQAAIGHYYGNAVFWRDRVSQLVRLGLLSQSVRRAVFRKLGRKRPMRSGHQSPPREA